MANNLIRLVNYVIAVPLPLNFVIADSLHRHRISRTFPKQISTARPNPAADGNPDSRPRLA
jgi:hypothetical protein